MGSCKYSSCVILHLVNNVSQAGNVAGLFFGGFMSQNNFTGGEWTWAENSASTNEMTCIDVRAGEGFSLTGEGFPMAYLQSCQEHFGPEFNQAKTKANAQLIASAPKLLQALRDLTVAANTVAYCYEKVPGNFASALARMQECAAEATAIAEIATTVDK